MVWEWTPHHSSLSCRELIIITPKGKKYIINFLGKKKTHLLDSHFLPNLYAVITGVFPYE